MVCKVSNEDTKLIYGNLFSYWRTRQGELQHHRITTSRVSGCSLEGCEYSDRPQGTARRSDPSKHRVPRARLLQKGHLKMVEALTGLALQAEGSSQRKGNKNKDPA